MRHFKLTPQLISLVFIVSSASVLPCLGQAGQTPASTTTTTTTNGGSGSPPATSATSGDPKKATDDSNKVEAAVAAASSLVDDANKYQKTIAAITTPATKSTQPALDDMQQLQTTVEAISRSKLFDSLAEKKAGIASAESTRSATSSECAKLSPPDDNSQPDVTKAVAACKKAGSDAKDKTTAIDTAVSGLQSTLGSISPYVASHFVALQDKLKRFSDAKLTGDSPDVSVILDVLPTNLPVLKQVLQNKDQYQSTWNSTKKVLSDLKITAGAKDASGDAAKVPDDEFKNLQAKIDAILPKLDAWFKTVADKMQAEAQSFDNLISGVLGDPAKNSPTALDAVRKQGEDISSAQAIADAWPPLVGFLVDGQPDGLHLKTTKSDLEAMQKWVNVARGAVSRVHDALAGDMSGFETDQVSLYYFTDVQRLMYALNEGYQTKGGVAEAQEEAKAQRKALTQTELELADAQATVNRYQKQVLDLQEQQRQAQAKLKGLNSNVSKLGNRLNNAQDQKNQADADYQQAKSDQAAAPTDPTKTTELNKAAAKQTAAATKLSQSQSDYYAAKSEQDKAQSQVDDSQNQSDNLPAKLAAAQQALSDAQTAVAAERRKMIMAAQAESDAFAFARDNTPFMVAFADASSSNPAKRVMLYAFNDSKTIFMRGKKSDVDEVKRIVAVFDQPAPQARLTLWTFELNAEAGQKANKNAANKLNQSMQIIDEELGDTRALQNTTLTLFRDIVNEEVDIESTRTPLPADALTNCTLCTAADRKKLGRLTFYDPSVLVQLGLDLEHVDIKRLRGEVPDPASTTTLGEALLVASLAPRQTREAIQERVEARLRARLAALPLSPRLDTCAWADDPDHRCPDDVARPKKDAANSNRLYLLPLTWHALGIWEEGSSMGSTSAQLEITRALRTSYESAGLPQIVDRLVGWYRELPQLTSQLDRGRNNLATLADKALQGQGLQATEKNELQGLLQEGDLSQPNSRRSQLLLRGLPPPDRDTLKQEYSRLQIIKARQQTIEQESAILFRDLQGRGFDVGDLVSRMAALPASADSSAEISMLSATLTPVLSAATPREAAADEMLKEMIIAIEDDLDRLFMQPMIRGLRTRLLSDAGVNVGILQRESMLATNRGKARVDPRASAQLAVGETEDILAGVQQLAQLYGKVQSGGALAALGALEQLPREPKPEIYALTTGNKFEVTPIFDPSGQALRFKFDFVGTSSVQEPNGTTNPQFPKIERHTVNTEVQLTNLEIREISRFESDARLGLPTQYSGGIPILKDIPYVRPWIPLIGWFVRKAGSNAVAQQSVIFGQTTIYPSIQTMVSLVEDSESRSSVGLTNGGPSVGLDTEMKAPPLAKPAAQPEQPRPSPTKQPSKKDKKSGTKADTKSGTKSERK